MKRRFNITGSCNPQRHYMICLNDRLRRIKEDYVDYGSYFVINKGRQYGKTTTLRALKDYLRDDYLVLSLDFQQLATENFADAPAFARAFVGMVLKAFALNGINREEAFLQPLAEFSQNGENEQGLQELFESLSIMCAKAP